jgi:glutamine synthetase
MAFVEKKLIYLQYVIKSQQRQHNFVTNSMPKCPLQADRRSAAHFSRRLWKPNVYDNVHKTHHRSLF